MADKQETTSTDQASNQPGPPQATPEPLKVEVTAEPEKKEPDPNPAALVQTLTPAPTSEVKTQDVLAELTPLIVQSLCFDASQVSEAELRSQNGRLQTLLRKVIELLKEKTGLCANLEKQNTALMVQSNSLKDVVAITKDLLTIRNMEVEHLHVDIKSMEEKINVERERHNNMLNRMSEAVKLNDNLKTEYQSQLELFTNLRARYEEKVVLLESENKRLLQLVSGKEVTNQNQVESTGEGDVQLSLESIPPP